MRKKTTKFLRKLNKIGELDMEDIFLVKFKCENYTCFAEETVLSFESAEEQFGYNSSLISNVKALPVCAIYGANASGKTNLLQALSAMTHAVCQCLYTHLEDLYIRPSVPFAFHDEFQNAPTLFEIVLAVEDKFFRYGFKLSHHRIIEEWLYVGEDLENDRNIYYRRGNNIDINDETSLIYENKDFFQKLAVINSNTLLLSIIRVYDIIPVATEIVNWFQSLEYIECDDVSLKEIYTTYSYSYFNDLVENEKLREECIDIVKAFDPCIKGIELINMNSGFREEQLIKIFGVHDRIENGKSTKCKFPFHWESAGTRRLFSILPSIINALQQGLVLMIDELDSHLHPLFSPILVSLFHSSKNKKGAQLIFSGHNSSALSARYLRIDEVWFTQKNSEGRSKLNSLYDFYEDDNVLQKNKEWELSYLLGRYGAVPSAKDVSFDDGEDS